MKFEITKKVRTPDGVEHDSVEAAEKHMFVRNFHTLGNASAADFEYVVDHVADNGGDLPNDVLLLRNAIRDVYLAAWPRASKGVPRGPRKPAETREARETHAEPEAESAPAHDPVASTSRRRR